MVYGANRSLCLLGKTYDANSVQMLFLLEEGILERQTAERVRLQKCTAEVYLEVLYHQDDFTALWVVMEGLMNIDYSKLPEHIRPGVRRYIENGILPGDFLKAVICNKLKESFMFADDTNLLRMQDIVSFFYNEAPIACWGSSKEMLAWATRGGQIGVKHEQETIQQDHPAT